jgi:type II secretory pathway predicted ATPase ExeA
MAGDPFSGCARKWRFESEDSRRALAKMKHVVDNRGIGLLTGPPGAGKFAVPFFRSQRIARQKA